MRAILICDLWQALYLFSNLRQWMQIIGAGESQNYQNQAKLYVNKQWGWIGSGLGQQRSGQFWLESFAFYHLKYFFASICKVKGDSALNPVGLTPQSSLFIIFFLYFAHLWMFGVWGFGVGVLKSVFGVRFSVDWVWCGAF